MRHSPDHPSLRTLQILPLLLGVWILSCAPPPKVDISRSPASFAPKDYPKVLKEWSREIRVIPFNGLDNILTARATYLSFRFREAYVETLSSDLDSSKADTARIRAEQLDGLNTGHQFFVSLMSAVKNCDNLTPEEGPWTIRLRTAEGGEVAPLTVEEIEKPSSAYMKYFAFNASYRKAYKLTFPLTADNGAQLLTDDTKAFEISFASPLGRGTARWEVVNR